MPNYNLLVLGLYEIMQVEAVRAALTDKEEMVLYSGHNAPRTESVALLLSKAQKAPIGWEARGQGLSQHPSERRGRMNVVAMLCSNK